MKDTSTRPEGLKLGEREMIVACIPAYDEEETIGGVVVRAMKHVDRVVVCDDGAIVGCFVHYPYIVAFLRTG